MQYVATGDRITELYIQTRMVGEDGYEIIFNDPAYDEIMHNYVLSQILVNYGPPTQVFIRSFSDLAMEIHPTQTLLYYPDEGVIVKYFSPNLRVVEDETSFIWTCPSEGYVELRLFDTNSGIDLPQMLEWDDNFSQYENLSDVTNMDDQTFYETYLESNCSEYIKTPEDIWPYIFDN